MKQCGIYIGVVSAACQKSIVFKIIGKLGNNAHKIITGAVSTCVALKSLITMRTAIMLLATQYMLILRAVLLYANVERIMMFVSTMNVD